MNYKTRDKIGVTIWFLVFGISLLILGGIFLIPIWLGTWYDWPIWVIIVSTLVTLIGIMWIPVDEWLNKFEDWLRKKLNL